MICSCHALFLKIIFETVFKLLQQSTFKEINKQRLLLIWIFILFFFCIHYILKAPKTGLCDGLTFTSRPFDSFRYRFVIDKYIFKRIQTKSI
jgi:uncharacterized membrane protein